MSKIIGITVGTTLNPDKYGDGGIPIIDVVELPQNGMKADCFYRLLTATLIRGDFATCRDWICYVVTELPEVGEAFIADTLDDIVMGNTLRAYYNITDNTVYGYANSLYEIWFRIPTGWYPFDELAEKIWNDEQRAEHSFMYNSYGGIIQSVKDMDDPNAIYLLTSETMYFSNGKELTTAFVGNSGSGFNAEVFNSEQNVAEGHFSHAEGQLTQATGDSAHAEGQFSRAIGQASHAEGRDAMAEGDSSHAEGGNTQAIGFNSHAEGSSTIANAISAHAEGHSTKANGQSSHAEGKSTTAEGGSSHAEGVKTVAKSNASHAEGSHTNAEGYTSHAEGNNTHAKGRSQHVQGEYNAPDPNYDADDILSRGKYAHIVGNGSDSWIVCKSGNVSLELDAGSRLYGYVPDLQEAFSKASAFDKLGADNSYSVTITYEVNKPVDFEPDMDGALVDKDGNEVIESQSDVRLSYHGNLSVKSFTSEQGITYMYFGDGSLAPYGNSNIADTQYPFMISSNGDVFLNPSSFELEEPYSILLEITRTNELRSNAHTVDWNGNGWFAGVVKVGGTGQDDEDAKELATKEYVVETLRQTGTAGVTSVNGQTGDVVITVTNGKDGEDGKDGSNGADGKDGEDGVSPTISVTTISGGHRVTITDANGTKTFDVMDGEDGKDGEGGTGGVDIEELKPFRFTVTKGSGNQYTSSATYGELQEALAEGRHIICELVGKYLPLIRFSSDYLEFCASEFWVTHTVTITVAGVRVTEEYSTITINRQLWDADDPNADFTDTINEMIDTKLGDIDTALDAIIAIQEQLIGGSVTLITFITPTGEYQAEEGMTWGEWVDSKYNTDGFVINNAGWVEDGDGGLIYDAADGGSPEEPSYVIIAGHTYIYD